MSDLIERNVALQKFIEGDGNDDFTNGYNFAVDEYRQKIAEIPTANRWILCRDRLPYGGSRVLATTKQGYVVDVIFVLKGSQWFRNGEYFSTDAVIAWMPMPDAYEPPERGCD